MRNLLSDSFEEILLGLCDAATVRAIDLGAAPDKLWSPLEDSGFVDALLPESHGGAGLSLAEIHPLVEACGRHALPAPFAESMVARAILAFAAMPIPSGPVVLAPSTAQAEGVVARLVAHAAAAKHALIALRGEMICVPLDAARRLPLAPGSLAADLVWPQAIVDAAALRASLACDFEVVNASLLAAQLAGAMASACEMTVRYAQERVQFGRPIGAFQAVQHQISIMAEQTALARTAARLGCASGGHLPDGRAAAVAKGVASEAAVAVAAIAHAVHGAIGITAEHPLQLFTRRLHEWRHCGGSEVHWYRRIGGDFLRSSATLALDFVREVCGEPGNS